jgi:hypothetical protein
VRSAWFEECYAFCQWVKVGTSYPPYGKPEKVYDRRQCQNPERHRSYDGTIQLCDMHMRQLQKGRTVDLIDGRSIEWADAGIPMNISGGNCKALWEHVRFVEVTCG